MKIVVIGGTGLIGSKVVEILRQGGNEVVVATPDTGVNTITGEGLADAFRGASVVVDVSNSPSLDGDAAKEFFKTAGMNISAEEIAAGVKHHVALSVVGTDRLMDSPYLQAKQLQEHLIKASQTPYTLVHATQFFEFIRGIAQSGTDGDTVRLPHNLFQPMAAKDVAEAVARVALDEPANDTVEIGGPEKFYMDELAARVLAYDEDPRKVVADPEARYFGAKLNDGALVPGPEARLGQTQFDWWIQNVPAPPKPAISAQPTPVRA
jgi:uncharacterized protein YbjT (DUF2867 family)